MNPKKKPMTTNNQKQKKKSCSAKISLNCMLGFLISTLFYYTISQREGTKKISTPNSIILSDYNEDTCNPEVIKLLSISYQNVQEKACSIRM